MSIVDYASLQTAIGTFLNRTDLTAKIPDFITLAEMRINRECRSRAQEKRVQTTTTGGQPWASTPSDMIDVRLMQVVTDPVVTLRYLSPEQMMQQYASATQGQPQAFTVEGQSFRFGPAPDGVYTLELLYLAKFAALSSGVNWLITNAPDVYLFASMVEAADYIKDANAVARWDAKFQSAIASVNDVDWYSGSLPTVRFK